MSTHREQFLSEFYKKQVGDKPFALSLQTQREYVVKLTDEERDALRKSRVNGPLYHLVKQILNQP